MDIEHKILEAIQALGDSDISTAVAAENFLIKSGTEAFTHLINSTTNINPQIRLRIAYILGKLQDPRVFPYLLKLVEDPVAEVKYDAIIALGDSQDNRAIPILLKILDGSNEESYANAASQGLAKLAPNSVQDVIMLLRRRTGSIRSKVRAIYLLSNIGDETALKLVKTLTKSKYPQLKAAALDALLME